MKTCNFVVGVAVDNTTGSFDKIFDYSVPDNLADIAEPGRRIMVPFGRGNRYRQGMIMYKKQAQSDKLKLISSVLDKSPVITGEMIRLAGFMKRRYFCTYYDAVKTMLPAGINYSITTLYSAVKGVDTDELSESETQVYSYALAHSKPVKKEVLLSELGAEEKLLQALCEKGFLRKSDEAFRKIGDAVMKMVAVNDDADLSSVKLSKKQDEVLSLLQTVGCASVKEICYYTGVTPVVVDNIVKKNLAYYYEDEVFRSVNNNSYSENKPLVLTEEQDTAFRNIYSDYKTREPKVSLLYGITGSGKTSVFLKLISEVIKDDKGIIVMVPEIALTPQFIGIFKAKFGDDVAVFHSGLSMGERLDEYKRVLRGMAKIAIGTRSAVFAPFKNLGLIIIDEEQEHTYKSESTPRYHAREVAKFRAFENKAILLLSSATPDIESFYHAKQGVYSLNILRNRYGKAILPEVRIVDMNEEVAEGNTTGFSRELAALLEENLSKGYQSILLLNRRGHNTFALCSNCRETVQCPNCSISLTYHSANNKLMCHYCGYSMNYKGECPTCHNHSLRFGGAGTQKIEQELTDLFPNARVLRLDADSTMRKSSHERLLSAFSNGEYDILIGTQMVAKGLNFPKVTLVGVLNPDTMLYSDDYRSYERTFSLLTQVVGRSGRGESKGVAVIQTYTPENNVITMAASQDYERFYNNEILIRKAMLYPPFADICMVGFVSDNHRSVIMSSNNFMKRLVALAKTDYSDIPLRILGPSPAAIAKISNKYRYKIIIKCRNDKRFRSLLSAVISEFNSNKENKNTTAYIDMNALSF
ncbi:MAG: primosomal protein N' [Ruminococcus sp.]|nr:primosomal protein N' [Ruminococcus sp.]